MGLVLVGLSDSSGSNDFKILANVIDQGIPNGDHTHAMISAISLWILSPSDILPGSFDSDDAHFDSASIAQYSNGFIVRFPYISVQNSLPIYGIVDQYISFIGFHRLRSFSLPRIFFAIACLIYASDRFAMYRNVSIYIYLDVVTLRHASSYVFHHGHFQEATLLLTRLNLLITKLWNCLNADRGHVILYVDCGRSCTSNDPIAFFTTISALYTASLCFTHAFICDLYTPSRNVIPMNISQAFNNFPNHISTFFIFHLIISV